MREGRFSTKCWDLLEEEDLWAMGEMQTAKVFNLPLVAVGLLIGQLELQ